MRFSASFTLCVRVISAPVARSAETVNSSGVFTLARYSLTSQNSGAPSMVPSTALMSPSLSRNVLAIASTSAGGGVSLTKRCASLVETKRAVAGSCASISSAALPSRCPFSWKTRPTRQHPRQLGHVLLRVAAVHAQGVQLHYLARIVFVEPLRGLAVILGAPGGLRVGTHALPVVQVPQHRRTLRRGQQQLA